MLRTYIISNIYFLWRTRKLLGLNAKSKREIERYRAYVYAYIYNIRVPPSPSVLPQALCPPDAHKLHVPYLIFDPLPVVAAVVVAHYKFFNRLRWAAAHTGKTSKIRLPKATPSPPYPCPPHPFARSCCKFKYLKQSLLHPLAAPASATFLAIARPQLHSSSSFDRPHPPSGQDPKRTHTWLIFFFISVFFRPDLSSMSVCRRRLRLWLRFGFVSNWQLLAYFTWHRSLNALKMHPTKKSTT